MYSSAWELEGPAARMRSRFSLAAKTADSEGIAATSVSRKGKDGHISIQQNTEERDMQSITITDSVEDIHGRIHQYRMYWCAAMVGITLR